MIPDRFIPAKELASTRLLSLTGSSVWVKGKVAWMITEVIYRVGQGRRFGRRRQFSYEALLKSDSFHQRKVSRKRLSILIAGKPMEPAATFNEALAPL